MTHPLSVAVAGLGTVGAGVLKLLRDNADLVSARAGRPIAVTAVSARDRTKDRGVSLSGLRWYEDPVALAADPAVDVIVELIGGSDGPARALAEAAIAAGKPFVTANKAMLAVHGAALAAAAERQSPAASPSSRRCARAWPATASPASPAS
jgi:homoserine dehydrogenase